MHTALVTVSSVALDFPTRVCSEWSCEGPRGMFSAAYYARMDARGRADNLQGTGHVVQVWIGGREAYRFQAEATSYESPEAFWAAYYAEATVKGAPWELA